MNLGPYILFYFFPSHEETLLSYISDYFGDTYVVAHSSPTGCELLDVHSMELGMERSYALDSMAGPLQSMGL